MKLYLIYNTASETFVKNGKYDTRDIDEAKTFETYRQAKSFRNVYCDKTSQPVSADIEGGKIKCKLSHIKVNTENIQIAFSELVDMMTSH